MLKFLGKSPAVIYMLDHRSLPSRQLQALP
jgi:hypothetical protein